MCQQPCVSFLSFFMVVKTLGSEKVKEKESPQKRKVWCRGMRNRKALFSNGGKRQLVSRTKGKTLNLAANREQLIIRRLLANLHTMPQ